MVQGAGRFTAVGATSTPAIQNALAESELCCSLRSQVDAINPMVRHALSAAPQATSPELGRLFCNDRNVYVQ